MPDVSGQHICPIFKGQAVQEALFLECLALEDVTDMVPKRPNIS